MFCGANEFGAFVHLGQESVNKSLAEEKGVAPFRPRQDMVMKDYLVLEPEIFDDAKKTRKWLNQSADYLLNLPMKVKKPAKKK